MSEHGWRIRGCGPLAIATILGCGAASPPAGPKHVPSNSEEAATACPKERKAAQTSREALLGSEEPSLSTAAAKSVLAQAHCEANAALGGPAPSGTQDQILAGLREIRLAVRDAGSLFAEVRRYGDIAFSQESLLADAKLTIGFADIVGSVQPPDELDPRAAEEFRTELGLAKKTLRGQAELLLQQSLTSEGHEKVAAEACKLLEELGGQSRLPRCN
ncbi:MAG: hypothetical protein GY811_26615 [Myxococcales bacterium]|nr:hypothetical protein [Myxococcales bacterium]